MAKSAINRPAPDRHIADRMVARRLASRPGRIAIVTSPLFDSGRVAAHLQSPMFEVSSFEFRRSLLNDLFAVEPDVVILEYGGPHDFDLVRVCRDLSSTMSVRIVVVSSDVCDPDHAMQIAALDSGADDFISASMSAAVVRARVRAALRGRAVAEQSPQLVLGDVVVDLDAHVLYVAGAPVGCSALHFALLVELAAAAGSIVSHQTLWSVVWGLPADAFDPRRLRQAVSALRSVLGTGSRRPRIESVATDGYRLVVPAGGAAA